MRTPALCAALLAGVFLSSAGPAPAAGPEVAVSIAPIHSLVAGVMTGLGEPVLIVKGGASPHYYALRPSDAQALDRADIVFWVGPSMESFLIKPLASLAGGAKTIALLEQASILRRATRDGGAWEEHRDPDDGGEDAMASGEGVDGHDETNPHIWLDPENARRIVRIAVEALSAADPENAAGYTANGDMMETRLDKLEAEIAALLDPVAEVPYVVFHDAYRYFEDRFGTLAIGSIAVSDGRKPGARRLKEIRAKIAELDARCVFAEPQFEPALIRTVIEGTGARAGVLDPLGADLPPGPDAYFDLMRNLARALRECLGQPN
ncbi:MAG: zinc ABC transporter solute-binding protein [Rhodospirillaceae bacterium]|nr:zinc ABC transporter solute-binding protein [Rhodospirillaceae bacterium]